MKLLWTWRSASFAFALLLAACGSSDKNAAGDGGEAPPDPSQGEAAVPEGELQDVPEKIDIAAARTTARTAMFVPAPTEFQAAVKTASASLDLAALVADTDRTLEGMGSYPLALETGVRVTNVLMTAGTGDTAVVIDRMTKAKQALSALKAPGDLVVEIDKVIAQVKNGSIGKSELPAALDVLAERIQDDLDKTTDPNVATLVRAGGWLQGAYLLSKAVGDAGLTGDASRLLHQPTLLRYFLDFLKESDPGRAGDPLVTVVIQEMEKMEVLATKDELSTEDVQAIHGHTAAILLAF
jgi:hypothetical protein